ncbi:MAG TPA: ABC transporter C-terminal domain-containing protein [Methylomirabilota bacterium]|nr:ABC transporter C-terminal domain-containing protein [Methylomirabilota bacterium]
MSEREGASEASGGGALRDERQEKKRADAETRKRARAESARQSRIEELEARIASTEQAIREVEQTMATPGFYEDRTAAQPVIDRHQALMWEVGDLMHQWEQLQSASGLATPADV